ncbi:HAD-IIA family hydrolase [Agromyces aerolatus]|uniref:HAD-IIA family hydrolase n=1 Tax=Agromyces sp. LY-1074 TaxID=3074080 RepID=UPI00285BCA0A|nr:MULTISPECIES: HAD-IIA family hydrolase [unclassified Agromyces]MDR5701757.1 HAD-IIA family hydrolase [Agromyces sp. LY-1074]MDR5708056.1 HAD-IIA family hydrolase [Agromyces sp. LY-1358]
MALFRTRSEDAAPLDGADAVLADLDGVVYKGAHAIPHAVESLNLAKRERAVGYITNNASRSDATVARHLAELGLDVEPADVVTSPQAAMHLLAERVEAGALVLVVGGEGIVTELERRGYRVTRSADDDPAAVVQGFAPDVGWTQLAEAAFALNAAGFANEAGIPWVATNMDWTIPVARGIAPGNGTLVSAVHTAVGRFPVVAGKPETPIFDEARRRFGAERPLVVGDRLDTDILGARRAGMSSALVLTGIDRAKQVLAAPEQSRPDYILGDLRGLHTPYPLIERTGETTRVRRAKVRIEGARVVIAAEGDDELDLLRAACAAIWGSGRAIHALQVPERLYA